MARKMMNEWNSLKCTKLKVFFVLKQTKNSNYVRLADLHIEYVQIHCKYTYFVNDLLCTSYENQFHGFFYFYRMAKFVSKLQTFSNFVSLAPY